MRISTSMIYQNGRTRLSDLQSSLARTQEQIERDGVYRVICDYIAGMTDRFAVDEHGKLFDPTVRV